MGIDVEGSDEAFVAKINERERCFNIVKERFELHYKLSKSFPGSSMNSADRMSECMIIMEKIYGDKFREWLNSLPKE